MKKLILAIFIFGGLFKLNAQADYSATLVADFLWAEEVGERWGFNFGGNFNLYNEDHMFPLFLGFNIGGSQSMGDRGLRQGQINSFARKNMRGTTLTGAEYSDGSNELGYNGGLNLIQYFFTNSRSIPYVGFGTRVYRFPKDKIGIDIDSEDSQYYYSDYEYD